MEKLFRGRFESKLDDKGRLFLPPGYRNSTKGSLKFVVTNSRFRTHNILDVYQMSSWEKLEKKINKLSQLKSEVQEFQRFYLAAGQTVEMDNQNRILVPQSLRQFAGLQDQVTLVGLAEKFEIWSTTAWQKLYEQMAQNFESNLAAVAELEEKK